MRTCYLIPTFRSLSRTSVPWVPGRSHPMDVVSPRILNSTGGVWFAGGGLDVETGRVRTSRETEMDAPFSWLTGACLAVSKAGMASDWWI